MVLVSGRRVLSYTFLEDFLVLLVSLIIDAGMLIEVVIQPDLEINGNFLVKLLN